MDPKLEQSNYVKGLLFQELSEKLLISSNIFRAIGREFSASVFFTDFSVSCIKHCIFPAYTCPYCLFTSSDWSYPCSDSSTKKLVSN